jgi:hypothetical protein
MFTTENPCAMSPIFPANPTDSTAAKHAMDVLDLWAKLLGVLVTAGVFFSKILRPYNEWRRRSLAHMMREVLAEELHKLDGVVEDSRTFTTRDQERDRKLDRILARQDQIFVELDEFETIAIDNRDRHDANDVLLTRAGIGSPDRRSGGDRRRVDAALSRLAVQQKARRRHEDPEVER